MRGCRNQWIVGGVFGEGKFVEMEVVNEDRNGKNLTFVDVRN